MDATGMGLAMWIFWIIVLLVVILVIQLLVSANSQKMPTSSESPIEILKKRYASGEIDDEEYERRKKDIKLHRNLTRVLHLKLTRNISLKPQPHWRFILIKWVMA